MAYIYCHYKIGSVPKIFYIGVGGLNKFDNYKRAKTHGGRSKTWHNRVKNIDWDYEILEDNLDKESALKKEIEWIKKCGRWDKEEGTLSNLTDGGDGHKGMSTKYREKLSKLYTGVKRDPEIFKKGKETLRKRGGFKHSVESKLKIKKASTGQNNPFYGKKHSEETKLKISKSVINLETGVFYNSVKEACLTTHYTYDNFKSMLNGGRKNITNFKHC